MPFEHASTQFQRHIPKETPRTDVESVALRGTSVLDSIRRTSEEINLSFRSGIRIVNMALVHNHSVPCSKSEMKLFSVPPTQMVIEDSEYVEYRPFGGLNALGPIDFIIPGTGRKYLDINNTQLYIKAKLAKADGSDREATNKVAPVNLLLHSMFSQGRDSQ